eukprot:g56058.t1
MTVVMCTESLMWYGLTTNMTKCSQRVSDNVRRQATSVRHRATSLARKCGQKEEETKNSNSPSIDTYPGSSAGLQANMELLGNLDRSACGASCQSLIGMRCFAVLTRWRCLQGRPSKAACPVRPHQSSAVAFTTCRLDPP